MVCGLVAWLIGFHCRRLWVDFFLATRGAFHPFNTINRILTDIYQEKFQYSRIVMSHFFFPVSLGVISLQQLMTFFFCVCWCLKTGWGWQDAIGGREAIGGFLFYAKSPWTHIGSNPYRKEQGTKCKSFLRFYSVILEQKIFDFFNFSWATQALFTFLVKTSFHPKL